MGLLRLTLLGLSGTILAACGGTTTQSIPVTLAPPAEGYATISTTVAGGSSFSSTTNRRLRLISGGASDTVVFSDEDIAITISASAVTATIVMNGNTYVFTQEPTRPTLYTSADGSVEIFVNPSQTLLIAELRISNDDPMGSSGTENHGHFVAGYQTDPAQVAALTGSAS